VYGLLSIAIFVVIRFLLEMPSNTKQFTTARTRNFRAAELSKEDERTISHIEEFGCSVVSVKRTTHGLGWSYTIGIFDTSGKPEIITVGLFREVWQGIHFEQETVQRIAEYSLCIDCDFYNYR
jgi:hypothetical protein